MATPRVGPVKTVQQHRLAIVCMHTPPTLADSRDDEKGHGGRLPQRMEATLNYRDSYTSKPFRPT